MKLDITLYPSNDLRANAKLIRRAEELGFTAAWVAESARNPFLALSVAASETRKIDLGTQGAAALPRSPMVIAQIAWDLARQSEGRFILGLDANSISPIDDRSGENGRDQVGRMREYIESLRAIWQTFQTDARLRYRGEHYTFRLMAPFFNPGAIDHPDVPIYLAGVNSSMTELAGELCQGVHAPALHTPSYLRDVLIPSLSQGLASAGRARSEVELTVPVFIVSGLNEAECLCAESRVRQQIAFHLRLPAYRDIVLHHGWEALAEGRKVVDESTDGDDMADMISVDFLRQAAIVAEPPDILGRIHERYSGLADRVCLVVNRGSGPLLEAILGA